MYVRPFHESVLPRASLASLFCVLPGCGTSFWPPGNGSPSSLNLSILPGAAHDETSANDLFERAEGVALAAAGATLIRGSIDDEEDVDVYDLGPVVAGDRVRVAMSGDQPLQAVLALFDDSQSTLLVNDHRNVYLNRNGPFIDVVMRRSSRACFVAVSSTPGYDYRSAYELTAVIEPDAAVPEPRPDVVLLVFNGERGARIGGRAAVDVPPFDATDIDPIYAGRTSEMIARVTALVRQDYAGYNVRVLSTAEGAFHDGDMSRIFFGAYDEELLGVAEGVDEYNAAANQEAIVFTDTFSAFMRLDPSVEAMSQALANVASHELGHLLGLVHTADPSGIMDVTAGLSELMEDQSFTQSPLHGDVFRVGYENEVQSLLDAVGGDVPQLAPVDREARSRKKRPPARDGVGFPPARAEALLSGCSLHWMQR